MKDHRGTSLVSPQGLPQYRYTAAYSAACNGRACDAQRGAIVVVAYDRRRHRDTYVHLLSSCACGYLPPKPAANTLTALRTATPPFAALSANTLRPTSDGCGRRQHGKPRLTCRRRRAAH